MDVSDVQVSDKDGFSSRSNTIKANSKIVKQRIWTLDSRFASKIELQPLEPDTDAQLHEERVISVRKETEFVSRVLQERDGSGEMRTPWKCDVEEFQELIKVAQKTAVTAQVSR